MAYDVHMLSGGFKDSVLVVPVLICLFSSPQVNGIDTVRIPMSVVPFEDPTATGRKLLKRQKQEETVAAAVQEAATVPEATISETAPAPEATQEKDKEPHD